MTEAVRSEARVRDELFGRLDGLARPKGLTIEAFERMRGAVMRKLAYMKPENLAGLAELIIRHAHNGVMPREALILHWAFTLEVPPPRESDYVASVMRSAMGRAALEGGYAVEMMRTAARLGPPPGRYQISKIKEDAAQNARRRDEMRALVERCEGLRQSDQEWLDRYHADLALAETMVAGGAE